VETLLWVLGSIAAVIVFAGVLPILVIGTWWVVLNGVVRGLNSVWWLLNQAEKAERLLQRSRIPVEAPGPLTHPHGLVQLRAVNDLRAPAWIKSIDGC
jgi:hypothetical protein